MGKVSLQLRGGSLGQREGLAGLRVGWLSRPRVRAKFIVGAWPITCPPAGRALSNFMIWLITHVRSRHTVRPNLMNY